MAGPDTTCWTLIHGAAGGSPSARDLFVQRYSSVAQAYLTARWRSRQMLDLLADAVQDVFLECFRLGGALERREPGRPGGFRAFFFGIVRNVARTHESRFQRHQGVTTPSVAEKQEGPGEQDTPSKVFDREWARAVLREAADVHADRARTAGDAAERRVEILRLRFQEGLPVREIASRWGLDPALIHREYARAREEYKDALRFVLESHHPGRPEAVNQDLEQFHALLR